MRTTLKLSALFSALLAAALVSQPVLAKGPAATGNENDASPVASQSSDTAQDKSTTMDQLREYAHDSDEQGIVDHRNRNKKKYVLRQFNNRPEIRAQQNFLRNMQQLNLSEEQQAQIQQLLNEHEDDWVPGSGVPGELHAKILQVLNQEQRQQFTDGRMGPGPRNGRGFN